VTAVLGPRPDPAAPNLAAWEYAVNAIEHYRRDYNIPPDEPVLLGPQPAAGSFQQRYDRRQAAVAILDALDKLDRPGFHRGPVSERICGIELITGERPTDRTSGSEP
jgi:hypothetical protein